jgi:hypothetical protein
VGHINIMEEKMDVKQLVTIPRSIYELAMYGLNIAFSFFFLIYYFLKYIYFDLATPGVSLIIWV